MNDIVLVITTARLVIISLFSKIISSVVGFYGNNIDTFIRVSALKHIGVIGLREAVLRIISPMVSIRYFEFSYVEKQLAKLRSESILDISSPKYMGIYLASRFPAIKYTMINPDRSDLTDTNRLIKEFSLNNINTRNYNSLNLPYPDNAFDKVVCISVIEHIDLNGDSKAIKEMYRVLKPGGKMIITTHVAKVATNEYRNEDQYSLGVHKYKSKYFYQRIYNTKTLNERLFSRINESPVNVQIWGEKVGGWFNEYTKRRLRNNYIETAYDLWNMMTNFAKFHTINDLPGIGIICFVLIKKSKSR